MATQTSHSPHRPVQDRTIAVDSGRQLTYTEYGDSNGVPVVLLHGTPGSRLLGLLFDTAAQEIGVRVLAFDRPGYGKSEPWPNRSIRDSGQFVTAVLDAAGIETAGLVAFSGGAPYALSAAATHPDRFDRVDIIGGATPPAISEETPPIQRLLSGLATKVPFVLRGLFRGQAWLATRLDPSFVIAQYSAGDHAESISADTEEHVKADFVEAFATHRSGAVTEFQHTATDWGIDFEAIDATVGLWHGANDTNVPIADAQRLETEIPTARLRVLEDADHLESLLRSIPDVLAQH